MGVRRAIFDPEAFYPFRSFVEGHINNWSQFDSIERFLRAILFHDEVCMEIEPISGSIDDDEHEPGPRNVVVGFGPVLENYDGLLVSPSGPHQRFSTALSKKLLDITLRRCPGGPGDPYYEAHLRYLQTLAHTWESGGSVVCDGELATEAQMAGSQFPPVLIERLDKDWKNYVHTAELRGIGPSLPPILCIILTRCGKREDIIPVTKVLREEWNTPRRKIWKLVEQLKTANTINEAYDIQKEFEEASKHLSPVNGDISLSPLRVIWDIFAGAGGGSVDAAVAGGDPGTGALVGGARALVSTIASQGTNFARTLFGCGALDLANRVRNQAMKVEPVTRLLSRHLTQEEKSLLQLS